MANQNELKALQSAIASAGAGWQAGFTQFSDMSDEEKKKYLGYTPGPNDLSLAEQERMCAANYASYRMSAAAAGAFGAPAAFDWRSNGGQNYVSPVKNQLSCGSCVAFGTIAAVESRVKIQRGSTFAVDLSEAQLFYCVARSQGRNCGYNQDPQGGWWPEPAMIAARDIGITDDACYPYTASDQNCTGRCADWANRVTKITGYTRLTTIAAMKDWISTNGPLSACFTVYNDFFNYVSGVYRHVSGAFAGGHCVCIVGYNDALGCWICKNSWGAGWGSGGYFQIAYGECGIEGQIYGVNGVIDNYWITGKKVTALWANNSPRNAYAYITDFGWKKISPNNDDGFINTAIQLAAAKAANANVNVYIENGVISTLYVF